MKSLVKNKFINFSKKHGAGGAIVILSTEALTTIWGGALLVDAGLCFLVAPLAMVPVSLFSTLPIYLILRKAYLYWL